MRSFPVRLHLLLACLPAFGQYSLLRVAGEATQRPDGQGAFAIAGDLRPCIEGQYVVFRDRGAFGSFNAQAIWSYNINDGSFIKLVGQTSLVPGGTGNFSDLISDSAPVLKNGIVTFQARDDRYPPFNQGIFTVPVAGGRVSRVANYSTADPSGGVFVSFDTFGRALGGFSADSRVVFQGRNAANVTGIYAANADGSALSVIADSLHPVNPRVTFPVSLFSGGAISGNTVAFFGQSVFESSVGYNAIYISSATTPATFAPDGSPAFLELMNSDKQLPGNLNTLFHTRVNPPVLIDNAQIGFLADDAASQYRGIFVMPAGGGIITPVVTTTSSLSGLGAIEPRNSFGGFSLSLGRVFYHAQDLTPGAQGNHGLYLWRNGPTTRIIGTGDLLDGRRVTTILNPGQYSLSGDRMAFALGLQGYGAALYVALPADPSIRITGVANAASYASQAVSPGEIVTLFGAGIGPAALARFQINAAGRVPAALSGARYVVNGEPAPPLYTRADQASAILPFTIAENSATILALNNGGISAPFVIPNQPAAPGLFSANASGAGQGAILNGDGTFNTSASPAPKGSAVILYGTGHGATVPALDAGQVTPAGNYRLDARVSATIGGLPAQVTFAGPAPALLAGVFQVNVVVPPEAPSGDLPVILRFDYEGGGASTAANLTVAVR